MNRYLIFWTEKQTTVIVLRCVCAVDVDQIVFFSGGRDLCCVTPLLEELDQEWVHMYWSG